MQDYSRPNINANLTTGSDFGHQGNLPCHEIWNADERFALFPEKTPGGFRTGVFFGNEAACPSIRMDTRLYGIH